MRRWAWMLLMSWLVLAPAAGQDALPLQLTWHAPSDCPSAARVREELARIARARPGHALEPLAARVYVRAAGERHLALLQTEHGGQRGERTLTAADCQTLLRSVTLVLALAFGAGVEIDSAPVLEDVPARTEVATVPATPAAIPGPAAREGRTPGTSAPGAPSTLAVAAPPERMALRGGLLLGAGAHFRSLLRTALTITGGATLEGDRFRADLRALGLLARAREIGADVEADLDGLAVAASACAQHGVQIAAALCGGGRAGLLWGRTSGGSRGAARAPLYALSTHLAGTWPARGLVRLRLEAGLTIALNRPLFVVENLGVVQRLPRLSPELALLLVLTP